MRLPRWMLIHNWQEQEKDTAKRYKGRRQAQSGAQNGFKEDVKTDKYLIQDKFTTKKSISIKLIDLKMLIKHADDIGKIPMMRITFAEYPINFLIIMEEGENEEKNN